MATAENIRNTNIDQLNSFLRGEWAAVETYRIALEKLDAGSAHRSQFEACLASHQRRVEQLTRRIQGLGGTPAESSGAWGTFVTRVEAAGASMSDKIAVQALESGEDHGLADYRRGLDNLSADVRPFVINQLLPTQEDTHARMVQLKRSLQA